MAHPAHPGTTGLYRKVLWKTYDCNIVYILQNHWQHYFSWSICLVLSLGHFKYYFPSTSVCEIWKGIIWFILEKNLINAGIATIKSGIKARSKDMKEFTLVKNHISVGIVKWISIKRPILLSMRIFILQKSKTWMK